MFKVGDEIVITKDTDTVMSIIKKGTKGKIIREKNSLGYYIVLLKNGNTYNLRGCFELLQSTEPATLSPSEPPISKTETTTSDATATNQEIKHDADKPRLSLVPILPLWESVARIREYGVNKYGDNECWKEVELKRYHDALLRHTAAISTDINAIDEESGMPHRWHVACNLAFIEYLIREEK